MPAAWTKEEQEDYARSHPPLPGNKEHTCTDVLWLVVFLLSLGGLGWIYGYAIQHGDYRRLTRGFNYEKELCGVDLPDRPYVFWCRDPASKEIRVTHPMCITECPRDNTTSHECGSVDGKTDELPDYQTHTIGHWCLPRGRQQVVELFHKVLGHHFTAVILTTYRDVHTAGHLVFTFSGVVAIITGYIYLYLLDKCAEYLVYLCEFILVAGSAGVGGFLIFVSFHGGDGLPSTGDRQVDLIVGICGVAFALILLCVFCCKNQGIATAVGCIEAACECMMQEPTLLFEPFIALFFKCFWLAFFFVSFVNIASTCEVDFVGQYGLKRHIHCTTRQWEYLGVWLFMFLWIMELCTATSNYVLAWTTQMWYFTPYINGLKENRPSCGVVKGYANAMRYHLGTLAFGSLLITYLRAARICLSVVAQSAQAEGNAVLACLAKSCLCCVTCFQRFLQYLTKNAYMDVAITSSNFCTAAGRAFELLTNEVPAVAVLNGTQFIFQISGIGLITATSSFLTLIATSKLPLFSDVKSSTFVRNPIGVASIAGAEAVLIALCFMTVFDTVGDTILYCFASEQRRRKEVDHERYSHKQEQQSSMFGWLFGTSEETEEEEVGIDYAPRKLKDLVEKSHGVS